MLLMAIRSQYRWDISTGEIIQGPDPRVLSHQGGPRGDTTGLSYHVDRLRNAEGELEPLLYTVGYGGRRPSDFTDLLLDHGVGLLIDVRESPRSRVPGFDKKSLSRTVLQSGIFYRHMNDLGNRNRKTDGPFLLVNEAEGMSELVREITERSDLKIAIMCAERSYVHCHRTLIAEKAQAMIEGLDVHHIR